MSRPPDYMYRISEALAEVMDDIGVNERLVKKRRKSWLLVETMYSIISSGLGQGRVYFFGSQTEGSTTLGLKSDIDMLRNVDHINLVIQSEWKQGVSDLMMIQNESISPGYCHLQYLIPVILGIGADSVSLRQYVIDSGGRLLCKNDLLMGGIPEIFQKHGPAFSVPSDIEFIEYDHVASFYCETAPHQVTSWLLKHKQGKWPTEDVLKDCRNAGCFVVPVGSKVHSPDILERELEWRISTSLQERYLMFSLNIPQLMCYILMKMILKTHIHPNVPDVLTSFMCKNVLLHCIANSSHDWHTGNLLPNLHLCLYMLKECVKQRNCPHFIIPVNNLLAGVMAEGQRGKLLDIIDKLVKDDEQLLFKIQIDVLGLGLKKKLNMIPNSLYIPVASKVSLEISYLMSYFITEAKTVNLSILLEGIIHDSLGMAHQIISSIYSIVERHRHEGDLQQTASKLLLPIVSSALGSVTASIDIDTHIDTHRAISDQANTFLEAGKESDALSGRLKLVSVLYCTGDMERAERELTIIQTKFKLPYMVNTKCLCYPPTKACSVLADVERFYSNEENIKMPIVAFCVRFLRCEINCVPHELRYEILKSNSEENRQMRILEEGLMYLIVIDSIPYLSFLQYKIYRHLQRETERHQALFDLARSIEVDLRHKETALNLLGQCLEQENRQTEALQCYIRSVKHRKRNNAARFLLCIQLNKLWKAGNT